MVKSWLLRTIHGTTTYYSNYRTQPEEAAKGKNVLAAHCHNTTGGAYVDFGLYRLNKQTTGFETAAVQKSVSVLPTQTYYTFTCGPVELDLVFTAPLMMDDLDLLSTPVNYISYRVRSLDKNSTMCRCTWRPLHSLPSMN